MPIIINKKKILKLSELTIETLSKAAETLNKRKKNDYAEKQRELIQQEIEDIEKIKRIISKKRILWPEHEALEIEAQKDEKKTQQERTGEEAPQILLIDDDPIILKSIGHFLIQNDFLVSFALNAEEGLKKILKENPDLIIMDIMMPGLDGYQFLKQLKSRKDTSDIPVIILSSLSRESDMLKGLENGAADYITKPFSPRILVSKIKKILGSKSNKCK
ncbi:MAG: response regulator transcription factor [Acidobacteriota bacterium]